jgi:AcrR family transcriptional regulator
MKTRDRILVTSLELFNLCGEPNVTTIDIANEMDISPGNLYYHFRNKDEIIFELFQSFEANILEVLQSPSDASLDMMDYWMYVHMIFEKIWEFRFLYRDPVAILERNDKLQKKFNRILDRKKEACLGIIVMMQEQSLIEISAQDAQRLATNITITATYWLNYQHIRHMSANTEADDLEAGVYQVVSHIAPYLPAEGREMLEAVAETYLGSGAEEGR